MARRLFTLLAALSLLLCATTSVLGLVSLTVDEPTPRIGPLPPTRIKPIRLAPGELRVDRQTGGGASSHGYRLGPVAAWSAVLPVLWVADRMVAGRGPRFGRRQCQRCGYDLRATPGRCPECGTAASLKEA